MRDAPIEEGERQTFSEEPLPADSTVRKEVEEIKEAVSGVISETSLSERVEALRTSIESISEEVQGWQTWWKGSSPEALEALKGQVDEIQERMGYCVGVYKGPAREVGVSPAIISGNHRNFSLPGVDRSSDSPGAGAR